jgi:hypothetical protein
MNNPADVIRLAEILGADAVVVGAVTDYSPYYPPRVGLQVSWYSPRPWPFYPGVPLNEFEREFVKPGFFARLKKRRGQMESCSPEMVAPLTEGAVVPRGQSPGEESVAAEPKLPMDAGAAPALQPVAETGPPQPRTYQGLLPPQRFPGQNSPSQGGPEEAAPSPESGQPLELDLIPVPPPPPALEAGPFPAPPSTYDPLVPLMAYTRMFDGADAKLTARLRNYVELSGDLRAGGWESYLYRSEDFIRFAAHVMIVEMLQLHGGQAEKRVVFKFRKYR